jgi:hypothetical protein
MCPKVSESLLPLDAYVEEFHTRLNIQSFLAVF